MLEVLTLAVTFPSVVYTVLLGVMLIYWLVVMTGVVHIGDGSDGALDGLDVGGGHDGLELGGGHDGLDVGGGHDGVADGGGEAELNLDTHHAGTGLLASLLSVFRLRKIPATISISLILTFCWLTSVVAMQIVSRSNSPAPGLAFRIIVLLGAPVFALPISALVSIPLAKVFVQHQAPSKSGLIGMTCRLRTGKVTDRFGEAILEDGGAGLILQVRVEAESTLKRGDLAMIVDFDDKKDSFLVVPLDSVMGKDDSRFAQ